MIRALVTFLLSLILLSDVFAENNIIAQFQEFDRFKPYRFRVESVQQIDVSSELSGRIEKVGVVFGETVHAGQILFEIDRSKLIPSLNKAQERLNYYQTETKRARSVFKRGGISASQLDALETALTQAEAERNSIAKELEKSVIVAPFDGIISIHDLQIGDVVTAGVPLMTLLADSNQIFVDIYLPHHEARTLKIGQQVAAKYASQDLILEVVHISPHINKNNNLRSVRMLSTASEYFIHGLSSTLSIALSTVHAVKLSANAVMFDDDGPYVFVKNEQCIARKLVKFHYAASDVVLISQGLKEGEKIISSGVLTAPWRNELC